MNRRFITVLVFALVVSAIASVVLYRLISARVTATQPVPSTKIVVASRNLDIGTLVSSSDVTTSDFTGAPPAGSFRNVEDVVGRGVVSPIYSGEAVLDSRLAARGAGAGLAATIPPGMRAVAIRVNDVVGVSGFVLPGMRVDVLIDGVPPQGSPALGTLTKTILQNIEVLSAGPNIQRDAEGKPVSVGVVNLLVTPEQAETLSLASNETKIQLVLRNPLDKEIAKTPGTAVANLFNGGSGIGAAGVPRAAAAKPGAAAPRPARKASAPSPPQEKAAPPPPPPPITVEVYHGTKKSEAKFANQEANP